MNTQTIEKVKQMKLYGIERAYNQVFESGTGQGLTFDELLAILIDAEYDERYNRKLERYIKTANLKQKVSVDMVDFNTHRNLGKNLLVKLRNGQQTLLSESGKHEFTDFGRGCEKALAMKVYTCRFIRNTLKNKILNPDSQLDMQRIIDNNETRGLDILN